MSEFPDQPPQFPTPYEPPRSLNYRPPLPRSDLLAPARRAAVVMFVVGGLALLFALFVRSAAMQVPDAVVEQSAANWPPAAGPRPSIPELRTSMARAAIVFAIAGGIYVGLGFWVRWGGKVPAIITIAVSGVAIVWLLVVAISLFFVGGNVSGGICALCLVGVLVPVFGIVIRFLVISLSTSRTLAAYRQHLALQQMYLYQQQFAQRPGSSAAPSPPDSIPDYNPPAPPPPPSSPPPKAQ